MGHNGGEPLGWARMAPLAGGSAEPPAEGIHKDTDGPDQASDSCQDLAHLPGHLLVLADFGMSASRLGHGPHLLPGSLLPRQGHWVFREKVPEKAPPVCRADCPTGHSPGMLIRLSPYGSACGPMTGGALRPEGCA